MEPTPAHPPDPERSASTPSRAERAGRPEPSDRVAGAVRLLLDELRARVARHPAGHLLDPSEVLDVALALPLGRNADPGAVAGRLAADLDAALAASLAHGAAVRPGRAFCLRCGGAECEHAAPPGPRQAFAGYGATGVPRWEDFAQLLLERGDPRVDRLYGNPPVLLAHTLRGRDLAAALLPAYRDHASGFHLHGEVIAGWYRLPDPSGRPVLFAVTFQLTSTRGAGGAPRWGLNVLGSGPEGQPLEHVADRLGAAPWAEAARWAQGELAELARDGSAAGALLDGLAQKLEKPGRADERRTGHARRRHREGERPTPSALADLARAREEAILVDDRRATFIVLGEKGRAHVFSPEGKLVTSLRTGPGEVERRTERQRWRPARPEEALELRARAGL